MTHTESNPTKTDWTKGWPETLAVLALVALVIVLVVAFAPRTPNTQCTYGADFALVCDDR